MRDADVAAREADAHEGDVERGARRAHAHVGGQREREPASGRRPVDGGDHRLGQRAHRERQGGDPLLAIQDGLDGVASPEGIGGRDVQAAAEPAGLSGEDDHADAAVARERREGAVELVHELPGQRVEALGPAQREPRDARARRIPGQAGGRHPRGATLRPAPAPAPTRPDRVVGFSSRVAGRAPRDGAAR
jgi:hypothetical protein